MYRRRLSAFAAAIALVVSFALSGLPASAQDQGYTVTLDVWTCFMTGGLPGLRISDTDNPSGMGRDCIQGADRAPTLRLNGLIGTANGNQMSWSGVSGDIELSALVATGDGNERTITEDTNLVATFYESDLVVPTTGTGEVHVGVYVCTTTPGAASVVGDSRTMVTGFSGCAASDIDSREWGLRVDGRRPDSFSGYIAVWSNLADGRHEVTTGQGAGYTFMTASDVVWISAWYDQSVVGPASESLTLPNTGAGPQHDGAWSPAAMLIAIAAASAGAGLWMMRSQRS